MNAEQEILVKRLREAGFDTRRFLRLGNKDNDKAACEPEWQKRLHTPEELEGSPYWGICGKDGLVLIDADKLDMNTILKQILPQTFEVRSPRRGFSHFYIVVEDKAVENLTLHLNGDEEGAGEIRAQNEYLVAPGTEIHYRDLKTSEPRIGTYRIIQDRPFAKMKYDDFMKLFEPYLGSNPKQPITHEQIRKGVPKGTRHKQGIKLANYLTGLLKFDYETALFTMREWNKLCRPPMDLADLERMVKNALSYVAAQRKKRLLENKKNFLRRVENL